MKTLLAALLATTTANAGIIATTETSGGRLYLTDDVRQCETGHSGLLVGSNIKPMPFCWVVDDGQILVTYADGDFRIYPAEAFLLREKAAPKGKAL